MAALVQTFESRLQLSHSFHQASSAPISLRRRFRTAPICRLSRFRLVLFALDVFSSLPIVHLIHRYDFVTLKLDGSGILE